MGETPEISDEQEPAAKSDALVVRVERDAAGRLVVAVDGRDEPIVDARLARCFPWSVPDSYISVRDADGKEITLLRTLDRLDPASRAIVEEELRDKIFNPKIQRLISHKEEFGVTSMTVRTDRGEVTFQIRSRDDVRLLGPGRALFRDADGNAYELTDLAALDKASRRHFLQYF